MRLPGATLRSTDTADVDGWSSDEFETYEPSPENTLEIEAPASANAEKAAVASKPGRPVVVRLPGSAQKARGSRSSISPDIQVTSGLDSRGKGDCSMCG